ncbi:MAG TPA: hypothetical protein VF585_00025 [Chthoniobacterales bacterium]|jgi:hypothetical protein
MHRLLLLLVATGATTILSSCATEQKPVAQTQAFGEPASTIPWNQPQKWEGGAGGFGAMRGGEE